MDSEAALIILVIAVVAFLIGLSKGGLGGTAGALATPMLALVMPADKVIGLVLPILMLADIFAVGLHWGRWNRKLVLLLIPGSIVGVIIGTVLITNAPTETLRTLLGVIVLIFAIYKILEKRILRTMVYKSRDWHGLVAGTITGFSSALAHTGGPPVSIYLLMQEVTPKVFIATSALFFLILNWIKVPFYIYADLFDSELLRQITWLLPLVPIGVVAGRWLIGRVDAVTFERIIVGLLLINALLLIFL
ncbi:MAG: sulfite exporter TauE/SafE family protein [Candidatus Promineifilaceae bacterium]